jgi:beta-aspartyl-peptidase (threonine type)
MPQAIIVHGGAWDIPDELVDDHREACLAAVAAGWAALEGGGTALDAVEAAIRVMETDPALDAGVGSFLNADGVVTLDAGVMDGTTLEVGSVADVQGIRHPITLARKVAASPHALLVGAGAERFAWAQGMERCSSACMVVPRELARWAEISADQADGNGFEVRDAFVASGGSRCIAADPKRWEAGATHLPPGDTVGAVALDARGNLASGTSTGGTPFKLPGRVGDSPLVGCGFYADSQAGGASCTGWGEGIMRVVWAKAAVDRLAARSGDRPELGGDRPERSGVPGEGAPAAARWAVEHLHERVGGLGGIILLDAAGRVGYAYNTPRMAHAYWTEGMGEAVFGI